MKAKVLLKELLWQTTTIQSGYPFTSENYDVVSETNKNLFKRQKLAQKFDFGYLYDRLNHLMIEKPIGTTVQNYIDIHINSLYINVCSKSLILSR